MRRGVPTRANRATLNPGGVSRRPSYVRFVSASAPAVVSIWARWARASRCAPASPGAQAASDARAATASEGRLDAFMGLQGEATAIGGDTTLTLRCARGRHD